MVRVLSFALFLALGDLGLVAGRLEDRLEEQVVGRHHVVDDLEA